jgi:hypothetical protein
MLECSRSALDWRTTSPIFGMPSAPIHASTATVPSVRSRRALSGYSGVGFLIRRAGTGFMQPTRGLAPGGGVNESGENLLGVISSVILAVATALPSSKKLRDRGYTLPSTGWRFLSANGGEPRTIVFVVSFTQISRERFTSFSYSTQVCSFPLVNLLNRVRRRAARLYKGSERST